MNDDDSKYRTSSGRKLTPSEVARLDEIEAALGDSDEVSETSEEAWATAVRGKHYAAMQNTVAIRLDPDLLSWLQRKGPAPDAEINRILREKMLSEA